MIGYNSYPSSGNLIFRECFPTYVSVPIIPHWLLRRFIVQRFDSRLLIPSMKLISISTDENIQNIDRSGSKTSLNENSLNLSIPCIRYRS